VDNGLDCYKVSMTGR